MDYSDPTSVLIAYAISNALAVLLLWSSWKKPNLARLLFSCLFIWASWANATTALKTPEVYLDYADFTFLLFYKNFILGFFSQHLKVFILGIAAGQLMIGTALLLKDIIFRLGCIGGMMFLVGIAPLGVGSAFPCSLVMATGLYLLYHKEGHPFLWHALFSKKPE